MTTNASLHRHYIDYVERLVADPTTDAIGHVLAQGLWRFAVRLLHEDSLGRAIDEVARPAQVYRLRDGPDIAFGASPSEVISPLGDDDGRAR